MRWNKRTIALLSGTILLVAFQNCSKVQVASSGSQNGGLGGPTGGGGGSDDPNNPTPTTLPPGNPTNPPGGDVPPGMKTASFTFNGEKKADIMLVIDDSFSMATDSAHLASRLSGFLPKLNSLNINWQMCVLTTDVYNKNGASQVWKNLNKQVFTRADAAARSATQVNAIFNDTINGFFPSPSTSGNERGIAALNRHIAQNGVHNCYRPGAVTSTIILSDEDEGSFGGNKALADILNNEGRGTSTYVDMVSEDKPEVYIAAVRNLQASWGKVSNLISNSIVVENDACRNHPSQLDSVAVIGTFYMKLSQLTQGSIGSICSTDYSTHLTNFSDRIGQASHELLLQCIPKAGSIVVSSPTASYPSDFSYTQNMNRLTFTSSIAGEFTINVEYVCE